jgi:hypothetical protein
MAGALIVVLLMATGDGANPSTTAAAKTVQDTLEGDAIVVVKEVDPERLTDAEATNIGALLNANAVVVLAWQKSDHPGVLLHVRSKRHDWIDRFLTFRDGDPAGERGRTIGYEVASIVATSGEDPSAPPAAPADTQRHRATIPRSRPFSIDLAATGATSHDAGGIGGDLAGRFWFLDGYVATRLGAGVRFGEAADASANVAIVRLAASAALRAHPPTPESPFGFGLRVDGLVLWQRLSRVDDTSSGSDVMPGLGALLEASYPVLPMFTLIGAVGVEVALGNTHVIVDNHPTTTLDPLRGVAEVGLRWEPQ